MVTINLRDYYSHYQSDLYVEVPDTLAVQLTQWDRDEKAYYRRRRRNKAYYSLDFGDDIEKHFLFIADSPDEYYEKRITNRQLNAALSMLPDKQSKRIYSHHVLGFSKAEIARAENVGKAVIGMSIKRGLVNLKKIVQEMF